MLNKKVAGRVVWEASSVAAFQGYVDIMALLKDTAPRELPKLPVLVFTGHKAVTIGKGSTLIPQFRLLRYVDRPACLPIDHAPQGAADDDAWGNHAAAESVPAIAQPAGVSQLDDDEIPW